MLVWHYHDDDIPGREGEVKITLRNLPWKEGAVQVAEYRIDDTQSNSYSAWQRIGSPPTPTATQYAALEEAGQLERMPSLPSIPVKNGQTKTHLRLPRQSVSLLVFKRV